MPILHALLAASQLMAIPAPSSRTCSAIDVVAPEQRRATRKRSFSAAKTLDLELRTRLRTRYGLSGDHVLRLKLFTPGGYLYQEITVPFHSDPPPWRRWWTRRQGKQEAETYQPTRVLPGFSTPVSVQKTRQFWRGRRYYDQVTAKLPVAGTSITLGSLFGRWTVVPYLDDETAPCGRSRKFVIRK
jgi:hypothetical protein